MLLRRSRSLEWVYIPEDSSLLRDVREPACSKLGVPSALECTSEDE